MPIATYRKKPVEVRIAGPWDATVDAFAELHDSTDGGFRWNVDGSAQVYDRLHDTWVNVLDGQSVIEGVQKENYPIAADVLIQTYDLVDAA